VAAVAVGGAGVFLLSQQRHVGAPIDCAASDSAFVGPEEIGITAIPVVDSTSTTAPFHAALGEAPPAYLNDFHISRQRGYVSTVVLEPKYRDEDSARRSALGYSPSSTPLVPLQGSVVEEHSGVLEAYQANWSFADPEAAHQWLGEQRKSQDSAAGTTLNGLPVGPSLRPAPGADADGYTYLEFARSSNLETAAGSNRRVGSRVLQLRIQGGRAVDASMADSIADMSERKLRAACAT
jgi:hypothetical protein